MAANYNQKHGSGRGVRAWVLLLGVLALTAGVADRDDNAPRKKVDTDVVIKDVPHVEQKPDFCGEACAEMYLRKLGYDVSQDDVFGLSGVDPLDGRGCYTAELVNTLKKLGFKVGEVWYELSADKAKQQAQEQLQSLMSDLARGVPSIVCMHVGEGASAAEHFRLVLGYDAKTDEVIYHEPAASDGAYRRMKRERFLGLWPLKSARKKAVLIRIRLEADKISPPAHVTGFSSSDYARHIMKLKKMVPGTGFTTILEKPFIVIGDEPPAMVRLRSEKTIKWAVDMLKQDYFRKDPAQIIDIWLLKDDQSYKKHAREIFKDTPSTPFGYYSHVHQALIMNISTGGGTLVHEIVHPFISSNFPECPSWFNEGLASLYEQCREKNGHICGLTNWRLAGLQKDILGGRHISFKELTHTDQAGFYNHGDNYAAARYLCYYLQEKGLLVKFYHRFSAGSDKDPTGYAALRDVLGESDMAAFEKRWEQFVLKLTFP